MGSLSYQQRPSSRVRVLVTQSCPTLGSCGLQPARLFYPSSRNTHQFVSSLLDLIIFKHFLFYLWNLTKKQTKKGWQEPWFPNYKISQLGGSSFNSPKLAGFYFTLIMNQYILECLVLKHPWPRTVTPLQPMTFILARYSPFNCAAQPPSLNVRITFISKIRSLPTNIPLPPQPCTCACVHAHAHTYTHSQAEMVWVNRHFPLH